MNKIMNTTIVKSADVLDLFISNSRLNTNEIVELSKIPKTSLSRILNSYETIGFLEKDNNGYYYLGVKLLHLGHLAAERLEVRKLAFPIMNQLHNEVEETVILSLLQGDQTVVVAAIEADQPIRVRSKIGETSPLYAGVYSRIILAFLPENEREDYIQKTTLTKVAKNTYTNKDQLRQSLIEARQNGYSIGNSEIIDLIFGLAAPIYNHKNEVFAALTIAGISTNFTEENIPNIIKEIKYATEEISRKLGYKGVY